WGNGTSSYSRGGSGGGISRYQAQPLYQRGGVTQSSSFRALPDVSFLADPNTGVAVIDSWDFGNTTPVPIGGTSLATPMWAGVIAIADQGRALAGLGTLDGATQTLPRLYALPSSDFHDITTGNNGYAARPAFDLVPRRGTPLAHRPITAPASSNDNFANGTLLTGTTASITGSNVNATKEAGEPNHAGYVGGHSAWYTWTAPSSGTTYFDTHGSSFDTLLAVYKGTSVSALTRVASNDDD